MSLYRQIVLLEMDYGVKFIIIFLNDLIKIKTIKKKVGFN